MPFITGNPCVKFPSVYICCTYSAVLKHALAVQWGFIVTNALIYTWKYFDSLYVTKSNKQNL